MFAHQQGAISKQEMTMFKKTMIALGAALVLATSLVSIADAQTAPRKEAVQPFTEAERLWFLIPQGVD
jgi:hypothetical protein